MKLVAARVQLLAEACLLLAPSSPICSFGEMPVLQGMLLG